jgi:hypothetical protein
MGPPLAGRYATAPGRRRDGLEGSAGPPATFWAGVVASVVVPLAFLGLGPLFTAPRHGCNTARV